MKYTLKSIPFIFAFFSLYFLAFHEEKKVFVQIPGYAETIAGADDPNERAEYELNRLKDPLTGKIPDHIRALELEYVKNIPSENLRIAARGISSLIQWNARGPVNVGGRTRAVAFDITNENIILAGSVSGGIWRSVDGGINWSKTTNELQNYGITCLVQDKRVGKQNIWYAGTGEPTGTSASGAGSFFLGNGIYKSIDSGRNWVALPATQSKTPSAFDKSFDLIWNIAIDNSIDTSDVIYAATVSAIYKSTDGGLKWSAVLGSKTNSSTPYYTDVIVSSTGIVYASLSSEGTQAGVWRSEHGNIWTKIIPSNFPPSYNRLRIGIAPSDENQVYVFGETPGYGKQTFDFYNKAEYNSLWKYTYISGTGVGSGGIWEDRSANLPDKGAKFDQLHTQGSYDLFVRVKPNDPNTIFIGGTNIYRSTDAFASDSNYKHIGGYAPGSSAPSYAAFPNHHSDQHDMIFLPSNPNVAISCSDGGLAKTSNCMADSIAWSSLNKGYISSQFYTIAIDHATKNNDVVIGGLQDNGTFFTNTTNAGTPWAKPGGGDGAFCAIADGRTAYYSSHQNAKIVKADVDDNGNVSAYRRIDPIGGHGYLFINPFILDPNDNNIMYLAGGKQLWRNNDLKTIPLTNKFDSISTNWEKVGDSISSGGTITALCATKDTGNAGSLHTRLYVGTASQTLFRIDNAFTGNPVWTDITGMTQPAVFPNGGNISCIAVDPRDPDKVMVVFSNYNAYSLYFSQNGGTTWTKVAGNLEEKTNGSGSGNGPSCRWASILPVGNDTLFLVGTSTGLYGTPHLSGLTTKWVQMGINSIGNSVVDMIESRPSDGLVVVGTHGNGVFSTNITDLSSFTGVKNTFATKNNIAIAYPNPSSDKINFEFSTIPSRLELFDGRGNRVFNNDTFTGTKVSLDCKNWSSGTYYYRMQSVRGTESGKVLVVH